MEKFTRNVINDPHLEDWLFPVNVAAELAAEGKSHGCFEHGGKKYAVVLDGRRAHLFCLNTHVIVTSSPFNTCDWEDETFRASCIENKGVLPVPARGTWKCHVCGTGYEFEREDAVPLAYAGRVYAVYRDKVMPQVVVAADGWGCENCAGFMVNFMRLHCMKAKGFHMLPLLERFLWCDEDMLVSVSSSDVFPAISGGRIPFPQVTRSGVYVTVNKEKIYVKKMDAKAMYSPRIGLEDFIKREYPVLAYSLFGSLGGVVVDGGYVFVNGMRICPVTEFPTKSKDASFVSGLTWNLLYDAGVKYVALKDGIYSVAGRCICYCE